MKSSLLLFLIVASAAISFVSADCWQRGHDECSADADSCAWITDCKTPYCCNKGADGQKCLNAIDCSQHGGVSGTTPVVSALSGFIGSLSLNVKSTTSLKAKQMPGTGDDLGKMVFSSEWHAAFGLAGGYHSNFRDGHLAGKPSPGATDDVAWVDRAQKDDDKIRRTLQVSNTILSSHVTKDADNDDADSVEFAVKLWNVPGTSTPGVEAHKVYVGNFRVTAAAIIAAKDGDSLHFDGVALKIKDKDGKMVASEDVTIDVVVVVNTVDGTCANETALPCIQNGPRTQFAGWKGCRDLVDDIDLDAVDSCGGIMACCDQTTMTMARKCTETNCNSWPGASLVASADKKYAGLNMPYSCCQGVKYAAASVLLSVNADNLGTSDARRSWGRALMCAVVEQGNVNPSRVSVPSTYWSVTNTDGTTNKNYVYARVRVLPYQKLPPVPPCHGICPGSVCNDNEPDGTTPEPTGEAAILAFKKYYHVEQPGADTLADSVIVPTKDNNPVAQMRTCARHGAVIVAGEQKQTCAAMMKIEDAKPGNKDPPAKSDSDGVGIGVILGATFGGLVVVVVLMYCVCCRTGKKASGDTFVPLV